MNLILRKIFFYYILFIPCITIAKVNPRIINIGIFKPKDKTMSSQFAFNIKYNNKSNIYVTTLHGFLMKANGDENLVYSFNQLIKYISYQNEKGVKKIITKENFKIGIFKINYKKDLVIFELILENDNFRPYSLCKSERSIETVYVPFYPSYIKSDARIYEFKNFQVDTKRSYRLKDYAKINVFSDLNENDKKYSQVIKRIMELNYPDTNNSVYRIDKGLIFGTSGAPALISAKSDTIVGIVDFKFNYMLTGAMSLIESDLNDFVSVSHLLNDKSFIKIIHNFRSGMFLSDTLYSDSTRIESGIDLRTLDFCKIKFEKDKIYKNNPIYFELPGNWYQLFRDKREFPEIIAECIGHIDEKKYLAKLLRYYSLLMQNNKNGKSIEFKRNYQFSTNLVKFIGLAYEMECDSLFDKSKIKEFNVLFEKIIDNKKLSSFEVNVFDNYQEDVDYIRGMCGLYLEEINQLNKSDSAKLSPTPKVEKTNSDAKPNLNSENFRNFSHYLDSLISILYNRHFGGLHSVKINSSIEFKTVKYKSNELLHFDIDFGGQELNAQNYFSFEGLKPGQIESIELNSRLICFYKFLGDFSDSLREYIKEDETTILFAGHSDGIPYTGKINLDPYSTISDSDSVTVRTEHKSELIKKKYQFKFLRLGNNNNEKNEALAYKRAVRLRELLSLFPAIKVNQNNILIEAQYHDEKHDKYRKVESGIKIKLDKAKILKRFVLD